MSSFQQLPKSIKNDPLHSSRCPVAGGVGVDGKMIYIQKRKKELNRFNRGGWRFWRMWLLTHVEDCFIRLCEFIYDGYVLKCKITNSLYVLHHGYRDPLLSPSSYIRCIHFIGELLHNYPIDASRLLFVIFAYEESFFT